jgi:hypothetical protein
LKSDNSSSFTWIADKPALRFIFSFSYYYFFAVPANFIEKIEKMGKKIKKIWKKGGDLITLLLFSVLMGITLSFVIDKTSHGWKRILEIFLFLGGVFFWIGFSTIIKDYTVDLWGWIKKKIKNNN